MDVGRKDDGAKLKWGLVPWSAVRAGVRVLMFGAGKYGEGNWRHVEDARRRYFEASQRHLLAWWEGERLDPESGESHLAHALCCVMFLLAPEEES